MTTCRDVSELVTDYLDHALPLRRRLSVRIHLLRCAACRNYLEQLRKTVRLLSRHPVAAPSPELEDRLVAACAESLPPP